ncbi:hypothetical protein F2P79_021015 [Pimephales promelas]|nr:hypothetical protein F2P79_021015 [Pimephales promelas]
MDGVQQLSQKPSKQTHDPSWRSKLDLQSKMTTDSSRRMSFMIKSSGTADIFALGVVAQGWSEARAHYPQRRAFGSASEFSSRAPGIKRSLRFDTSVQ